MPDATKVERAEPSATDEPVDPLLPPMLDVEERIGVRRTEAIEVRVVTAFLDGFAPALIEVGDPGHAAVDQDALDEDIASARTLAVLAGFKVLAAIFRRWTERDPIGGSL